MHSYLRCAQGHPALRIHWKVPPMPFPKSSLSLNLFYCRYHSRLLYHHLLYHFLRRLPLNTTFHSILSLDLYNPHNLYNPPQPHPNEQIKNNLNLNFSRITPSFSPAAKIRPHQILLVTRSHSLDRQPLQNLLRTFSLPYLSPSSSPELFPERIPAVTVADPPIKLSRRQAKAANHANQDINSEQCRKAVALCTVGPESVADYQLRKSRKPLLH